MTSAQLWSQATEATNPKEAADIGFNVSPKLALDNKQRNGGAFLPFSKERNSCHGSSLQALPELALSSAEKETEDGKKLYAEPENAEKCPKKENSPKGSVNNGGVVNIEQGKGSAVASEQAQTNNTTTHRKARRCWSPDLHRRFVNALQMLGGSQGIYIYPN